MTKLKYISKQNAKRLHGWRRMISLMLVIIMFFSDLPSLSLSAAENKEQGSATNQTGSNSNELIYDYDTLKIMRDGKACSAMSLYEHEKIEVQAEGLTEDATYQWQVQHPEKDDVWVNIYDGTQSTIGVSLALVGNVLREDGTAKVRCRAYTDTYAYLSDPITVTLISDDAKTSSVAYASGKGAALLADGDPAPEFVTVTIEYIQYDFKRDSNGDLVYKDGELVYDEGKQAFTSYMATIHGGSNLKTTVHFPTMVGYDSYFGDGTTPSTSYTINLTGVTANVVYTVKYLPAEVDYVVRYYFQNIYDDLYVEDVSMKVNAKGRTGSVPPDSIMEKVVSGFTPLYYQPDAIAADSSTVFEVYYERNYYLMEFDCDGGYGTETLYVRYGSYISIPEPVKMGYVFDYWNIISTEENGVVTNKENASEGDEDILPATMPAYNSMYKAIWTTTKTTYSVVYWVESENGTKSYIGSVVKSATSSDIVFGSDDLTAATNVCGLVAHDHDGDCGYSCGKTVHTHNSTVGQCCSFEAHTHSVAEGCYKYCTHTVHNQITCYTTSNLDSRLVDYLQSDSNAKISWNSIVTGGAELKSGYTYRYRRYNTYYNYFYLNEKSYYLGEGQSNSLCGIGINNGSLNMYSFNEAPATVKCSHSSHDNSCLSCTKTEHTHGTGCNTDDCPFGGEHSHTVACYACGLVEHTHTDACKATIYPYLEYKSADQNKIVEGDGSTVVNVYYQYRTYTIRFIYARKDNTQYQIANSTGCGQYNNNHSSDVDHNGSNYGQGHANVSWINVNSLPAVTDSNYSQQSFSEGDYTYYYIALKAMYGEDIEDKWPDASIGPVGSYKFGSWGAECASPYRKYNAEHANIVGPYPVMSSEMIVANPQKLDDGSYLAQTMVAWWGGSGDSVSEHAYHIFYEVSAGKEYDVVRNGKYYKENRELEFTAAHNGSTRVDPFMYNGYTIDPSQKSGYADSTSNLYSCDDHDYCHAFYYSRNIWTLAFVNYNSQSETPSSHSLGYDTPLSGYAPGEPEYPVGIEPGGYEFKGWYTTPECYDGTEVKWNTLTMPDGNMTLYAKWSPVLRTVTFYSAFSDIAADVGDTSDRIYHFMKAENVPHGTTVGSAYLHTPEWPEDLDQATNGGAQADLYDFVGWFYMDEDNKKKFAPDSMEITRDLVLFAEWQTTIDTTYTVDFVLKEDASKENTQDGVAYPAGTKIAETIFAHSTVGKTKTFAAKGLGELLPAFRKKFFPTVNTHSILMEPDGTLNTYTFEYIYDDTVYYKVRYVDYSTRTEIAPSKVRSTDEAIVTEKFLPISGYLPQSYYIRKALAYDGNATAETVIEENTITFYYIKDTEHGLYSIEYYLENVDSTNPNDVANYYQYETIVGSDDLIVGGVQNRIKAEIRKYEGFTHMPQLNTVITYDEKGDVEKTLIGDAAGDPPEGPLDYTGLTIRIYYQRNEYPYIIEYREYGAAADKPALMQIADGAGSAVIGDKANYDSALTHTALPSFKIDGQLYEYYIDNPTEEQRTKSTTIRKSDDGKENKLVFYYKKHEVTVIYSAVCKTVGAVDYGIVSLYSERAATAGGLSGSTAIPGVGYRFVGWYTDAECTNPVDPSWRYTPGSPDVQADSGTKLKPGELDATKDEVQYYALFEPIVSSMEISNTTSVSTDDTFLFRVQGIGKTAYIDITIAIQGSGSTVLNELPVGEYLVTELTGWSWEYDATVNGYNVTITESGVNKTEFSNTYHNSDWLNGECYKDNAFTDLP